MLEPWANLGLDVHLWDTWAHGRHAKKSNANFQAWHCHYPLLGGTAEDPHLLLTLPREGEVIPTPCLLSLSHFSVPLGSSCMTGSSIGPQT